MEVEQRNLMTARVPFTELVDLASSRVGGCAIYANDEFFAPKENLLKPEPAIFISGKYTENGKWMDGWESRRKRGAGFDYCIVRLGIPGVIHGFNVATDYFIGNYPEYCSIEACNAPVDSSLDFLQNQKWQVVVEKTRLHGGTQNYFATSVPNRWTHVRLNIFPDGGVSRLRVHGVADPDWRQFQTGNQLVDLAAIEHGGTVVTCNDSFFGPKDNLIMPGRAVNMGDGWETRRRRGPGHDWIVVRLGKPGVIKKLEIDTNHFKGNFPESCAVDACNLEGQFLLPEDFSRRTDIPWMPLLEKVNLNAHKQHVYEKEQIRSLPVSTHVRLTIFPDGGISRMRVFGHLVGKSVGGGV